MKYKRDNKGRFMKGTCSYNSQFRKDLICKYCNKKIIVKKSSTQKYCDRNCFIKDGIGKWNKGLIRNNKLRKKISRGMIKAFEEGKKSRIHKKSFKKGHKPWNYIDGRSKTKGPARYGDDWDKIRYLVYLRDRFTCQDCGIKGIRLHIHHKIPFLISFDNSLNNLITLCRSCHRQEEAKIMRELKNQQVEVQSCGRA